MYDKHVAMLCGVLALFCAPASIAHEQVTSVIVDTDVALDDVRALSLLLQDPGVNVLAVVTSDGGSSPCQGALRVSRVLEKLGLAGCPVGVGRELGLPPPAWRGVADVLDRVGESVVTDCGQLPSATDVLMGTLDALDGPVTWVAVGPLTNLADLLAAAPEMTGRIRAAYFMGDAPGSESPGWNVERDRDAAAKVFSSGIPLYVVSGNGPDAWVRVDGAWIAAVEKIDSPAAQLIGSVHRDPGVARLLEQGHAQGWDDTVALALLAPEEFATDPVTRVPAVYRIRPNAPETLGALYLDALRSGEPLRPRPNVVLDHYPMDPASFRGDVAAVAGAIRDRYGDEEWKAAVLTSELHRHLGIYSLVGVKMGIRARELLNAGLDDLEVESHAGLEPPVSCLTDGLQVATGASLGRGSISVAEGERAASAVFVKGETKLRLSLEAETIDGIRRDVQDAIQRYGALTPEYFDEIRRLSIRYWLELDRRAIFLETLETDSPHPNE